MKDKILTSGELSVFINEKKVFVKGESLILPALSYKLLVRLMQAWPETVSQNDLLNDVWGDVCVQNNTLNQRVKLLRQSLKEAGIESPCIDLERGIGFRFAQKVEIKEPVEKNAAIENTSQKVKLPLIAGSLAALGLGGFLVFSNLVYSGLNSQTASQNAAPISATSLPLSIAVRTVINQSQKPDGISNSVAQEIVSVLNEVNQLSVIDKGRVDTSMSDSSWLTAKSPGVQPKYFSQLKVAPIHEGFQISVEVKQLNKSAPVWEKVYNVRSEDVYFSKFDIVADLKSALLPYDKQKINYRTAANLLNPTAYDLYLRSKIYQDRNTVKDNTLAHELIAEAYQLSPSCLDIITGYSSVLADGITYGHIKPTESATMEKLGEKANQLFPHVAKGYLSLGYYYLTQSQWIQAKTEFEKALSMQPHLKDALVGLTEATLALGDFSMASENIETLRLISPSATDALVLNAHYLNKLQLSVQAEKEYQKVLKVEPDNIEALLGLAETSLQSSSFDEFWQQIEYVSKFSVPTTKQVELELRALFLQRQFQSVLDKFESTQQSRPNFRLNDKTLNLLEASKLLVAGKNETVHLTNFIEKIKTQLSHSENELINVDLLIVLLDEMAKPNAVTFWRQEKQKHIAKLQMKTLSS